MSKFNYKKAEADLYDVGARHPDEIYDYKSEKAFRSFMKENGLNPDKYYKPDEKSNRSKSGSSSGSGSEGCYLTSACVMARGLLDHCESWGRYDSSVTNTWPGSLKAEQKSSNTTQRLPELWKQSTDCPTIWRFGIESTKNWCSPASE